ncbi:MAG TPA: hypothetical protein DEH22_05700 [Chloroflexi bacterium]|nr:hypothetical protein [Chloroflexota bacterium]
MKKLTLARVSIFLAIFVALLLVMALPGSNALADEGQSPNVRFTILNYSHQPFSINLYGSEQFSYTVAPYSKLVTIVPRGTYSFTMEACKHTSSGTINLNIYQTMHVPVCGGTAKPVGEKIHDIDTSDYIKMVRITIRNKTKEPVRLYLRTLDNHYYLNLLPRETTTLVVPRDRYVYSFVACGDLEAGYYEARVMIPLDLKCTSK